MLPLLFFGDPIWQPQAAWLQSRSHLQNMHSSTDCTWLDKVTPITANVTWSHQVSDYPCRSQRLSVTTEAWHDLITLCKNSFPSAVTSISSIIPARGCHHFNNMIVHPKEAFVWCELPWRRILLTNTTPPTVNGAPPPPPPPPPPLLCLTQARLAVNFRENLLKTYDSERIEHAAPSATPSYWRSSPSPCKQQRATLWEFCNSGSSPPAWWHWRTPAVAIRVRKIWDPPIFSPMT